MNKVEICGVNTAKLPVLPNAKMRELLARIKEGDMQARRRWFKAISGWYSA